MINSFLRKLLLPLLLCLLIIFFRHGGLLQQYELRLIDYFFQWKPSEIIDDRIVMVGITEADIEKLQVNRLSDLYLYNLIGKIESGNPVAVGLDIFRDHPVPPSYQELQKLQKQGKEIFSNSSEPPGHKEFLSLFKKYSNLFGIGIFQGEPNDPDFALITPPEISKHQITGGGTPIDDDYVKRRSYLWDTVKDGGIYNLAFALSEKYLQFKGFEWKPYQEKIWANHKTILKKLGFKEKFFGEPGLVYYNQGKEIIFRYFSSWDGPYAGTSDGGFQIINNWRKANFEFHSISEVMEGKVPASIFHDRVVLIGSYAPSLKDMLPTPINVELRRMHGIEIFAQTISQILSAVLDDRPLVRPWSEPWISVWILSFGLSIYFAIVNLKRRHWWLGIALILSLTIILLIWSYISFLRGVWISTVPSILTLWILGISALIYKYENGRKKDYLKIKTSLSKQQIYKELAIFSRQNTTSLVGALQYLYNYSDLTRKAEAQLLNQYQDINDSALRIRLTIQLNAITVPLVKHKEKIDQICLFLTRILPEAKNLLPLNNELVDTKIVQAVTYFHNTLEIISNVLMSDYGIAVNQVVVVRVSGLLYLSNDSCSYLTLTVFRILNDIIFYFYEMEVIEFSIIIYGSQKDDVYEIIIESLQQYQAKDLVIVLCGEESKKWGAEIMYDERKWKITFPNYESIKI